MIVVTRLNDSQFAINPDLIERIHENPDTTLVMVDGAKYIVTESMAQVIELVARYRSRIVSLAYDDYDEQPPAPRALELVPTVPTLPAVPGVPADPAPFPTSRRGR
jgi:flagellar protein FlbD